MLLLADAGGPSQVALWSPCTNNKVPPKPVSPRRTSYLNGPHVLASRQMSCLIFLPATTREAVKPFTTTATFRDPNKLQGHKPNSVFLREQDGVVIEEALRWPGVRNQARCFLWRQVLEA